MGRESNKQFLEAIKKVIEDYWSEPNWSDIFKLLIACIVSQRTRSEVTRKVVEELFSKYRDARELAHADIEDIQRILKPAGLYRMKARAIIRAANYILTVLNGQVPNSFEELLKIPGIGRKCANIVLAYGFGKQVIAVDANVERICKRLGLVRKDAKPVEIENTLTKLLPKSYWRKVDISMVRFGRTICKPTNPRCAECPLSSFCKYYANQCIV
ncbi:MAG: endonuclease III domain-containing protein [Candidatus Njordarchaeales archaeon]